MGKDLSFKSPVVICQAQKTKELEIVLLKHKKALKKGIQNKPRILYWFLSPIMCEAGYLKGCENRDLNLSFLVVCTIDWCLVANTPTVPIFLRLRRERVCVYALELLDISCCKTLYIQNHVYESILQLE
jgi:hypothetical protein